MIGTLVPCIPSHEGPCDTRLRPARPIRPVRIEGQGGVMAFRFLHLDELTRPHMLAEVDWDETREKLYLSPRLTERGRRDWPELLKDAIRVGNEVSLAERLRGSGRLRETESRTLRTRPGRGRGGWGMTQEVKVPGTAAATLSEGEFNRFYIRGLCLRALEAGIVEVVVYRAMTVEKPRPESIRLVGCRLRAAELLSDLRGHWDGGEPTFRVPGGPNSGLSIKLP